MLFFKLTLALAAVLMATLLAFDVQAANVHLGYCTEDTNGCKQDFDIMGDPNIDQKIPGADSHGNTIKCNSFKATVNNIKVCACDTCKGCPLNECQEPNNNACAGSSVTGMFKSICNRGIK